MNNNYNYDNNHMADKKPEQVLKNLFGYDEFRPGQKLIIDSILSGRDTFLVMPTGAGKSICYQLPAMLLPGSTLVISPLISLMQDQVKVLNEAGIPAAFINSSMSVSDYYEVIRNARQGLYKIIYVAPERLVTEGFLAFAKEIQISMIAVDEAHCISQWGQDFRPSYMKIVEFVNLLKKRPIISAFTATATETVREDVICTLGLNNPYELVSGFDRENLFFQVDKPKNKGQYILDYIAEHPKDSGIIYCATRKNVDYVYELLKNKGVSVVKYHAGMDALERKQAQDEFIFDYTGLIVATNAFGMGIDKSNVRFVIHYNMPQSMENYYQEAGRAGRDGLDAKCILLFSIQDIIINQFLLEHKELQDLNPEDCQIIKERDYARLKIMERYCYTTECLRNYILKYFGEQPEKSCKNCGNCLHEFKTLDMTDAAKKIINCVYEAKGRYGKEIIIDAVSGSNTEKIRKVGADKYKSYGVLESINKNLLRSLVEQMILEEYLTIGHYQVIKLGDISPLKNPTTTVVVKIADADKTIDRATKKKTKESEVLMSEGFQLFEKLKELRLKIAREEKMPPYVIFNDKTLIDMALKVPTSQQQMMNVSGVGEHKYAKYGERFISEIKEWSVANSVLGQNNVKSEKIEKIEDKIVNKKSKKTYKQAFFLLKEEIENFRYANLYYISDIHKEMNRICKRDNVKRLTRRKILEILVLKGLITEVEQNGRVSKIPTDKGYNLGIKIISKTNTLGKAYDSLAYPKTVQRMLVENFLGEDIAEEAPEFDEKAEDSWLIDVRKQNAGAYMPWSEEEDKKLINEFKSGQFSIGEISEIHGRTIGAIRSRIKRLGLADL